LLKRGYTYVGILLAAAAVALVACQSGDSLSPVAPQSPQGVVQNVTAKRQPAPAAENSNANAKACKPGKVEVCHLPPGNPDNVRVICIADGDLVDHLDHGDQIPDCAGACTGDAVDDCAGVCAGPGEVLDDGNCCASGVVDDCGVCDGDGNPVTELLLQYNGQSPGQVEIKQQNGDIVFNSFLLPGDVFPVTGTDSGPFGPYKIYVDGVENATIDTSCLTQIVPDSIHGDFELVSAAGA